MALRGDITKLTQKVAIFLVPDGTHNYALRGMILLHANHLMGHIQITAPRADVYQ